MKTIPLLLLATTTGAWAESDPQITSWFTAHSSDFAHIYRTEAEKKSGQAETTWSNGRNRQNQPAYCGVQAILSSSNWVYVLSTDLGSQVMGPWAGGHFPNLPTDQHLILALPRHPSIQTGNRFNHLGEIGMFVDGVRIFDANDAFSYSHQNGRDADPRAGLGQGDHVWNRDALVNEGRTLDTGLGHQQNQGRYHYHAEPVALRYLLGDHMDLNPATQRYQESTAAPAKHSPILGWMQDGYPIYGPYGYANPTNPASGLRRMVSGFAMRDGKNGTDNLATDGRKTLPAWEAREQHRNTTALAAAQYGPEVTPEYPLGHYLEDYAYLGDCGKIMGTDFDLDELNGRWCVTPEFPQGTYAYFTTITADGQPAYPYNMGRRYHGNPGGRLVQSINEPVTTNFINQVQIPLAVSMPSQRTVSLVWKNGSYTSGAQ